MTTAISKKTLYIYTTKVFLSHMAIITLVLLGLVLFFDTIELLRRASHFKEVPLLRVLQMSFLKLPEVTQTISPFIILFSSLFTLWSLNSKNEVTIFRLAGYSVWQFIFPMILSSTVIGLLVIGILNPIGTILVKKFNALEQTYLSKDENEIALFKNGIWLKQPSEKGYAIIHAKELNFPSWTLDNVMALAFNDDDEFLWRIDSPKASLREGEWAFESAHILSQNEEEQKNVSITLPTTLTPQKIEKSFSSTETMSFWQLPKFIQILESTGFDSASLRIHFQSLMALPFFFASLILISACVTLRPPRSQNAFKLVAIGIGTGFILFFLANFLKALGASSQIPIFIAAWSPVAITALLGGGILLSLEDG